jgi:hypothetical protein
MPLGNGIGEMWSAVRDRVEVGGDGRTWHVTAASFDAALAYARDRFDDPAVLARKDRSRWWPRVTLTVTTDATLAQQAPALGDLAGPVVPVRTRRSRRAEARRRRRAGWAMPPSLEEIFAHQEELRLSRQVRGTEVSVPAQAGPPAAEASGRFASAGRERSARGA